MGKKDGFRRISATDKERSIIKHERTESSSLDTEIYLGAKYGFPNTAVGSLESFPEAHHGLIDESKIQEDVKLFPLLPDYGKFKVFDLPNYMELSAISKGIPMGHQMP